MRHLLDLFIASSIPVIKVLLATGLGSYLATDHIDILGDDARKHMNNVVFFVFNPALVYGNLAKTLTYDSMVKLWFMPFNILFAFVIGSALGWVIIQITRPPTHIRGLVLGCCAAGNLGNLVLIIVPAVCKEKGSPFGDPDVCHTYAMTYASLSMALGAIFLWSYVYNIIRLSSSRNSKEVQIGDSATISNSLIETFASPSERNLNEPLLFEDNENKLALPRDTFENNMTRVHVYDRIKEQLEMLVRKMNLKKIFAPSTAGAIAGFLVGLVPQIRKSMIGDEAPLRVIQDTALLLGDGTIPAVTLILGGNLLKGFKGFGVQKSVIFGIIIVRYVVLPLIGVVIVRVAVRFGFVHDDALYQFVLLLQFALPPAMNIGTMTQLFGAGESECSVIMLWCYSLASLALTLWSTFFLWLVVQ